MVNSCCVVGCITVDADSEDVILFKFPTSRVLRAKWLDALKLTTKESVHASVCSRHFLKADYEQVRGRTRLKGEVVPTVFTEINNTSNTKCDVPITKDPQVAEENDVDKESNTLQKRNSNLNNDIDLDSEGKKNENSEVACSEDVTVKSYKEDKEKSSGNKTEKTDLCSDNKIEETKQCSDNAKEVLREKSSENLKELGEERTEKSDNCDLGKCNSNGVLLDRDSKTNESINVSEDDIEKDNIGKENVDIKINQDIERDNNCNASISQLPNGVRDTGKPEVDKNEDIEDLLTNYHIKQNNIHSLDHFEPDINGLECIDITGAELPPLMTGPPPVFIEVSVDKEKNAEEDGRDCLMVLESVQVEVNPNELMLERDFEIASDDLDEETETTKEDPISLLTSSDEDDVIIQEPKIDTVEVSDETDEDDMPLVKLVKKKTKKKKSKTKCVKSENPLTWGMYEFYCVECHFRTTNRVQYNQHRLEHTKVLLMCQLCGYMTSSESQLARHEKQHKDYKRYQCHLCDYKAKHKMSLVYHLKSHNLSKNFKCNKCKFSSSVESEVLRHVMLCRPKTSKPKLLKCGKCKYSTNRSTDLRRHRKTHKDSEDEDEEYVP